MSKSPTTQTLSDHDIDPSSLLKAKFNNVARFPIYEFLLVFNSNILSNTVLLREIS